MTVLVHGSGPVELAAALEFASVGLSVTVIDSEEPTWPEHAQEDPNGALTEWLTEASDGRVTGVRGRPPRGWIQVVDGFRPLPEGAVFGIPPSPLSTEVMQALGTRGAFRAYTDRLKPILTVGQTKYIGDLVRKRTGEQTLNTFVAPIVWHRLGVDPNETPVATLAPGLSEAVSRVGSLTAGALAFAERHEHLTSTVVPNSGWGSFRDTLRDRLTHYGVTFRSPDEARGDGEPRVTVKRIEPASSRRRIKATVDAARPSWWPDGAQRVLRMHRIDGVVWTTEVTPHTEAGERFLVDLRSEVIDTNQALGVPELDRFELQAVDADSTGARVWELPLERGNEPGFLDTSLTARPDALAHAVSRVRGEAVTIRRDLLGLS